MYLEYPIVVTRGYTVDVMCSWDTIHLHLGKYCYPKTITMSAVYITRPIP